MMPTDKVTRLVQKLSSDPRSVRWGDLVSSPQIQHTPAERERVLQTGGSGKGRVGGNAFSGWSTPWLFWDVLKAGLLLILGCFLVSYGCQILLENTTQLAVEMLVLIPPMVVPITLMVFFWELNVPGNMSIWELGGFFLVGTLICLAGNSIMFVVVESDSAPLAALREEPAKLLAGVLLLMYFRSKGKYVCGLTGLAIGAAVGSGFSAFETISYGLHTDWVTVILRALFAVVGHTLYSCSYTAALALHSPDGKITSQSFFNSDFLLTFGCSVACHAFWNSGYGPLGVRFAIKLLLLWYSALYVTRISMAALLSSGPVFTQSHTFAPSVATLTVQCVSGALNGKRWVYTGTDQVVTVGRDSSNRLHLPDTISGISRNHCRFERQAGGWAILDTNSSYGTYIKLPGQDSVRLTPGQAYQLRSDTLVYLGSSKFCLSIHVDA